MKRKALNFLVAGLIVLSIASGLTTLLTDGPTTAGSVLIAENPISITDVGPEQEPKPEATPTAPPQEGDSPSWGG